VDRCARNKIHLHFAQFFIISGVKHLKDQNGSAFPEEEESASEREEKWNH
jgi:hypothetical protein